jgi:hypothetical protein
MKKKLSSAWHLFCYAINRLAEEEAKSLIFINLIKKLFQSYYYGKNETLTNHEFALVLAIKPMPNGESTQPSEPSPDIWSDGNIRLTEAA